MRSLLLSTLTWILLTGCSGTEIIPDDSAGFAATGFTRYAWRSEPLEARGYSRNRLYAADPVIREAVDEELAQLGYQRVERADAQFLVDYLAAPGMTEGRLARNASNVTPIPTGMINRQVGQAEVDNAYALGGVKETGNIALVFLRAGNGDLLWKVLVSAIVENANSIDTDALGRVMRRSLATLPAAGG